MQQQGVHKVELTELNREPQTQFDWKKIRRELKQAERKRKTERNKKRGTKR